MDWGEILASLVLDLVFTTFFYLLVPVILCIRRSSLTQKQIKKIVIVNGAVVWLVFRIIITAISGEPGTGAAVFLWSAVANGLLKKYCMKEKADRCEESENTESENIEPKSIDSESIEQEKADQTNQENQIPMLSKKAERFCSKCGGAIDANTKQCTKCGKQYFKGFTPKNIALVVLSILLGLSLIFNVIQAVEDDRYTKGMASYDEEMAFYDEHAVCVGSINDNYHKYDCWRFDDSEFWIFNIEYAEYLGYEPCPYCCD